jgi:hypothetical protein
MGRCVCQSLSTIVVVLMAASAHTYYVRDRAVSAGVIGRPSGEVVITVP